MRSVVVVALALAWIVGGVPVVAAPSSLPVEIVRPAPGETLTGGTTAEIEWAPAAGFAQLDGVEEWEAFLSLDGGATYPFRITPHLDSERARFTWRVPALPSRDARLLLRFGDERQEQAFELPHRWVIEPPAWVVPEPVVLTLGRGEAARPGEAGVVEWVEGSRSGDGLRRVRAEPPELGGADAVEVGRRRDEPLLADGASPTVHRPPLSASSPVPPDRAQGAGSSPWGRARLRTTDLLLQSQRRNE
jgi:hypothetical protein